MDIEYVGSYIEGINQSVIKVYRIVSYHKREYSEKIYTEENDGAELLYWRSQ